MGYQSEYALENEILQQLEDSGARSDRFTIKIDLFMEMPILFPNYEEQIKIGHFLEKIENSIKRQSTKIDLLKQRKQGLLKKMFV